MQSTRKSLLSVLNQGEDTEDWAYIEPTEMEASRTNVTYNNPFYFRFFPQEMCEEVNSSDAHEVISKENKRSLDKNQAVTMIT